jgi:hypothetical protein
VVAASRRRGFHKGLGGRKTSKFPQNCLRANSFAAAILAIIISITSFSHTFEWQYGFVAALAFISVQFFIVD